MLKSIFPLWVFIIYTACSPIALASPAQEHLQQGIAFSQEKKYDDAISEFQEALKFDPKNINIQLLLGLTYASIGKYGEAMRYTREVADKYPSFASFYNLGLIHAVNKEPQKAIADFDHALEFNPQSYLAEYQKGLVYTSQQNYQQAAVAFQRAVDLNPQFDQARLALAGVSKKNGDFQTIQTQISELEKLHKDTTASALNDWMKKS